MKKIVFFGTSEFSKEILKTLKENFEILAVVTQPDRPVGRKQEITESVVSKEARSLNVPIFKPENLKEPSAFNELKALPKADAFVVVAYGHIIPKGILDLATPINIHGSLLPKFRGASPIQSAILSGETQTGITIMLMDEKMDHGPVLKMETVSIGPQDTFRELEQKLCSLAKEMIVPTINDYLDAKLKPVEQNHSEASFCQTITKEDGKVDWNTDIKDVFNKYRAFIQWPGIWTTFDGKILKILKCSASSVKASEPGMVFEQDGKVFVGCTNGSLEILELQLEGKNPTTISDFVRGYPKFVNTKL
ncbi:MAG: methionyl-tRNA formyltransferase [Candidatus Doudnabacteria bacterium]